MSETKRKYWRPMVSAPRDGTVIISVHTDGSGVMLMYWGETHSSNSDPCWVEHSSNEVLDLDDEYFGGWIPCPITFNVPEVPVEGPAFDSEEWGITRLEARADSLDRLSNKLKKAVAERLGKEQHSEKPVTTDRVALGPHPDQPNHKDNE